MTFHVVLTGPIHSDGLGLLEQHARVTIAHRTDEVALGRLLADADALILRANARVTATVLDAAPGLRVIGRHGVGLDNIDLAAAAARGVEVVYTPYANTTSVAEHTVACVLALLRHLVTQDSAVRSGDWRVRDRILGMELSGRVLGVVGMGNIGSRVASILRHGFGMRVVYSDPVEHPQVESDLGATRLPLMELLQVSDVVTVHVPLTPATHGLLDAEALALLRPGAVVVNVSRGGVVDEGALLEACESERIAGAALDVFTEEPLPADHPLRSCERILLTPHSAAMTVEGARRMSLVADDVLAVLTGRRPRYPAPAPAPVPGPAPDEGRRGTHAMADRRAMG